MSNAKPVLLLDLDRTSIRTTRLWQKFQAALLARLSDKALIAELGAAEREARGSNFDPLAWLGSKLAARADTQAHAVAAQLHDPQALLGWLRTGYADNKGIFRPDFASDIVIEGFFDVLAAAAKAQMPILLVTAGDTVFQQMKVLLLEAIVRQQSGAELNFTGFDYIVISNSKQRKTALIAECFDDQGTFHIDRLIQEGSASYIADAAIYADIEEGIVVDDKTENTVDAGTMVTGVLVHPDGAASGDGLWRQSLKEVAAYITRYQTT